MSSLFADGGTSQQSAVTQPSSNVLQYKMGKMTMDDDQMVHSETDKGLLLFRPGELPSIVWKNRSTGQEDEPTYVFPGEQVFRRCKSAPASSRVFYLSFPGRKLFFWMQEPDASNDLEFCRKLNIAMNGRDDTTETESTPTQAQGNEPMTPAVSTTVSTPAAPTRPTQQQVPTINDDMMQQIMSGLASQARQAQADADLRHILSPNHVEALLNDPSVVERLVQHLPEGGASSVEELRENIHSPQYQQALASFSMALQSHDLDAAMGQFGVDGNTAQQHGGGVAGLCEAIDQQEPKDDGEQNQPMDESKD